MLGKTCPHKFNRKSYRLADICYTKSYKVYKDLKMMILGILVLWKYPQISSDVITKFGHFLLSSLDVKFHLRVGDSRSAVSSCIWLNLNFLCCCLLESYCTFSRFEHKRYMKEDMNIIQLRVPSFLKRGRPYISFWKST